MNQIQCITVCSIFTCPQFNLWWVEVSHWHLVWDCVKRIWLSRILRYSLALHLKTEKQGLRVTETHSMFNAAGQNIDSHLWLMLQENSLYTLRGLAVLERLTCSHANLCSSFVFNNVQVPFDTELNVVFCYGWNLFQEWDCVIHHVSDCRPKCSCK